MKCRFYGHNGMFGRLIPSGGNECAMIRASYSPCAMEVMGLRPDETTCERVQAQPLGVEGALSQIAAAVKFDPVARSVSDAIEEATIVERARCLLVALNVATALPFSAVPSDGSSDGRLYRNGVRWAAAQIADLIEKPR